MSKVTWLAQDCIREASSERTQKLEDGGFYGTQVLPGHPPRTVYYFLSNLNIKYKMAFGRYLRLKKLNKFF
jgi:hypothetical protein